jgi:hypothetical protein
MEPDISSNVASCIFLPYMSVALGGASTGSLSPELVGVEMPAYRYLKTVDLPTYDVNHFLPLVNRGAVARFFNYHTQESIAAIAAACGEKSIKIYDYDFQVHTRTNAIVGGKFDIALPTSKVNKGYLILKKDGTYQKLEPHSIMAGWNIGTVVIADHGNVPFTVNVDPSGQPIVGDGSNRTLPHALPTTDDLIGVRIVEIVGSPIESLFKDWKLPVDAVETEKGIEYTELFVGKSVLLSNSMLDGWSITGIKPPIGTWWRAQIVNGEIVVTFLGNAYDEKITATLTKDGSSETVELEIRFFGEKEGETIGCNAGSMILLVLLGLCPIFVRRKN